MFAGTRSKKTALTAAVFSASLGLTACFGANDSTEVPSVPETTEAAETTVVGETTVVPETTVAPETTAATDATTVPETATEALITVATTELGDILVGEKGATVYGFTKDIDGDPTCVDACAQAWPPVTVEGDELPAGLDPAVFSLVDGVDGKKQLKAGSFPLYYFANDAAGATGGQGVNNAWFVVSPTGELIKE